MVELRHSWYSCQLQDLPVQGVVVTVLLRMSRRRCLNGECKRRTFAEQLPGIAAPYARRTQRVAELVQLFGHCTGGRPGERLQLLQLYVASRIRGGIRLSPFLAILECSLEKCATAHGRNLTVWRKLFSTSPLVFAFLPSG